MKIPAEFSFESRYADVKGVRMHYIEQGEGRTLLFLHGNPTSSYLWRNIIPEVSGHARCVAPDLIGFGKSDKPDIGYTFLEHYAYLEGFIEAMGLRDIILVSHDWGGALGFYYAMNHPGNVRGIAFMETFAFTFAWGDFPPDFRMGFKLFRTPVIGKLMIMVMNMFVGKILPKAVHGGLTREILDNYKKPFPDIRSRYPVWVWPNELPIEGRENETFRAISTLARRFRDFSFPMLMFTSTPGGIINERKAAWFRDNAKDLSEKDIGPGIHYLQEDNPVGIASGIVDWVRQKSLL